MPILYYFIAWIVVSFTQVVIVPRLAIMGIFPDILTAVVVIIALKHGRVAGVWFGFAFAISIDLLNPARLGWMTLLISLLGYTVGLVRDTIYIENPWFEATMILLATFIYHLLYRLFPAPQFFFDNFLKMLTDSIFIAIYTVAVTGIVLWLLRQKPQMREIL
jgi:rod shape-determining protein MreD